MGLLDIFRRKKITHDDPSLGRLTFSKPSTWQGDVVFPPTRDSVLLFLSGDTTGPSAIERHAYEALIERYAELKGEIEEVLFELYDNYRSGLDPDETPPDFPRLSSPPEIWECAHLFSVSTIDPLITHGVDSAAPAFELTYVFDWHDDHVFDIAIVDWKTSGVGIDG